MRFGIGIKSNGHNVFVMGPSTTGRHTMVMRMVGEAAAAQPAPADWCYVNNFEQRHKPKALRLPAGLGNALRRDMEQLIEDLKVGIPAVFESDDYRNRRQVIDQEFRDRQEQVFEEVREHARTKNIGLIRTPTSLALAPVRDDEIVTPEEFRKLPKDEQEKIEADIATLQGELQENLQKLPQWDKERRDKLRALNREATMIAVGHQMSALRERYAEFAHVVDYLNAVEADVIENAALFLGQAGEAAPGGAIPPQLAAALQGSSGMPSPESAFRRYEVNVLVGNAPGEDGMGAPVVHEDNPTQPNLVGRAEHMAEMGALLTDFGLLRAGALHRANGGYLVLDARKLLLQPYAYEELKRVLTAGEIRIQSIGQALSLVSTISLDPEPIPLDVKVIVIGERMIYYLLCMQDPEFDDLFEVAADFEDDIERDGDNTGRYVRVIATLAREAKLRALDRDAVARVIEHSARLANDLGKLTARLGLIGDLLREADYVCGAAGRDTVTGADVAAAIDAKIRRADRIRERGLESIRRQIILIDTGGAKVGQINGLSVLSLGNTAFGRPTRITARVRMGRGEVIDIEREVELGGPTHSKGVLILASYIGARYAIDKPLSLAASLVFEQSYGGVDGDSASSTELYAILSALSDVPIRQGLAVTGSVNQHGEVQAIGGANEKIEGFFDVCKDRGLTGEQGVLIPAANVRHLMLRGHRGGVRSRAVRHLPDWNHRSGHRSADRCRRRRTRRRQPVSRRHHQPHGRRQARRSRRCAAPVRRRRGLRRAGQRVMAPNDIRRVLVALDDSMESRSALVAAAGIAKRLHAELIGLFIEDTRLLQLAGHPAVRHVSGAGHAEAGADALAMERALRAQAALMHAALARAAETQALQWSFRVARGRVAAELLAAAPEADMMVLGKTSLSGKGRGALGSAARAFAASTSGAVLYSDHRPGAAPHEASVVVVYDDGPAADRALEVAARVASRDAGALNVLLPGRAGDASDGLRERVAVALAPSGLDIAFGQCSGTGCAPLIQALARRPGSLLVIGEDSPMLGDEPVADLIGRLHSPVLVVGAAPA